MKINNHLVELVDRALHEAQHRGQLQEFNRAYSRYRNAAEVAGIEPMHYRRAHNRLRDWIYFRIKSGKSWGIDKPMIEWVLSGKNFIDKA